MRALLTVAGVISTRRIAAVAPVYRAGRSDVTLLCAIHEASSDFVLACAIWIYRRMVIRMPRMQVYLPEALYRAVKERGLPASELLQKAVAAELRRQELEARADEYLSELIAEVGEPSETEIARADEVARRLQDRALRAQAG